MKQLLLVLSLVSCYEFDEKCGCRSFFNIFSDYSVGENRTPEGIHLDTDGVSFNSEAIDIATREVYECLHKNFPDGKIPHAISLAGWCYQERIRFLDYSCLKVKVPSNWELSCDAKQQILQDDAPESGCLAKDLNRDFEECPCRWRAGLKELDDYKAMIVTTPSLFVYKDPLVRWMTGCDYPWSVPELTECMRSNAGPLDLNELPNETLP